MKFIPRGLSIKDVRIVGGWGWGMGGGEGGRLAKSGQRWTESNTLSFKENLNMPFEDTNLVADW